MKALDRNYATAPHQYQRPSMESFRGTVDRQSHKVFVVDNKENQYYRAQQQAQQKLQVRPSSSSAVPAEKQVQAQPRPYSSSQREKTAATQSAGPTYLSQMHVPSAPVFKKPTLDAREQQQRNSMKKETLKNSILIQQKAFQYTPSHYSSSKSNRFFQQEPQQQVLYQSIPKNNNVEEPRKTDTEQAPTNEYQEYRKLQDKLQYLENKIISIKSNIDNSNSQLAKTSSRTKKGDLKSKGLTAKFFGRDDKRKPSDTNNQPPPDATAKSTKHKQESSTPSLSSFITQVKQSTQQVLSSTMQRKESVPIKTNKPESAKAASSQEKKSFNRKSSQDLQKYSSMSNLLTKPPVENNRFLFYVSSVIKAYMSQEQAKPIEQAREHLIQTIQAIQFAKTMKQTPQHVIDEKRVILPKREQYRNKKTLIFDLDETLIHCNENVQIPGDVYLPIRFPTGELIEASVNIRPYAQQILEQLSKHFELIVFTASHSCYANVVLDFLDPGKQWISHRLFRESCVQTEEGAYIKDLRVIGNRQMSDMLLIDNAAYSFGLQIPNGVPILPYYDNKQDQELGHLHNYLLQFRTVRDMRDLNARSLRMDHYAEFNDPVELLQSLYKEYII